MKVIGISGLHGSINFKKHALPGLDPRLYRIAQGLDAAAALVTDNGVVAAAAEERFTGEKTTGSFPINAINYCLCEGGLRIEDINLVAHGFDYGQPHANLDGYKLKRHLEVYSPDNIQGLLTEHFPGVDWTERFVPVRHHYSHAASAYYLSGFSESLVLVADGMGELESTSLFHGKGIELHPLKSVPSNHSLGTFYGAVTLYLGFEFNMDEYKVMGLAPYGDRERFFDIMMEFVKLDAKGSYRVPAIARNVGWRGHETLADTLRMLTERLGPPRIPGEPVNQRHMDVAAAVQAVLEKTLIHTLTHFKEATGVRRLSFAGGVALNCSFNGLLAQSQLFDEIFIQPAAGDDGSALGAALSAHVESTGTAPSTKMAMPYWGPRYSDRAINDALSQHDYLTVQRYADPSKLVHDVAALLAEGNFLAWFQDRMEFGPRALGNRSILADPRDASTRDRLNDIVKQREDFRPFAPVVRDEDAGRYFNLAPGATDLYRHMLFVAETKPEARTLLSAVTHVDGSARVQVLRRSDNRYLWDLLAEFGRMTGVPVLLNTSFNLRGQPIICDPDTALATFARSRLDYMVLGGNLVSRST